YPSVAIHEICPVRGTGGLAKMLCNPALPTLFRNLYNTHKTEIPFQWIQRRKAYPQVRADKPPPDAARRFLSCSAPPIYPKQKHPAKHRASLHSLSILHFSRIRVPAGSTVLMGREASRFDSRIFLAALLSPQFAEPYLLSVSPRIPDCVLAPLTAADAAPGLPYLGPGVPGVHLYRSSATLLRHRTTSADPR